MHRSIPSFAAAIVSVAWLFSIQPAAAQGQPASPAVSDQQLDKAAAAIAHVRPIQKSYQERISKASPGQRERLADDANRAMTKAVTDEGLSLEEYSSILELAQNDPSVRDRLVHRIRPDLK